MDDALRYSLVIEMSDLLAKDEVFEESRAAESGFQRVLVVSDRHSLVGHHSLGARIDADPIERSDGLIHTNRWRAAAYFVRRVGLSQRAPSRGLVRGLDAQYLRAA